MIRALVALLLVTVSLQTDLGAQDRRSSRRSDDSDRVEAEQREARSRLRAQRAAAAAATAAAAEANRNAGDAVPASAPRVEAPPASNVREELTSSTAATPALERGRYTVLVNLDENRLYFKQGDLVLWSAPVGTGTGMRVITHEDEWEFNTPTGKFEVQYKERDPVWIAPDWYFVENNLPVPPTNHPSRYMRGTLGVAAVYLSPHVAIHGTNRPELIGQRVSHGCIRLENRYALRLYHNVQVGTEVVIVGGKTVRENARVVDLRDGYDPTLASSGSRQAPAVDPRYESWKDMKTDALLAALDAEMFINARTSRWDEIAMLLLERARTDNVALVGLLKRSESIPSAAMESEMATYLAYVYRTQAARTIQGLSELDARQRRVAASMIVGAMLTLYNGDLDAPAVPWPSALLPAQRVPRGAERGWEALVSAERDYRARIEESLARS